MDITNTSNVRRRGEEPPDFEDWEDPDQLVTGDSIRERMVDVILQLREPTTVASVAERVDCDTETARDYLEWFAGVGMVREHAGRPVRYSRNESYLRWRRIERIWEENSEAEIVEKLADAVDALEGYRDRFDADAPAEVSILEESRDRPVEEVWTAVSEWRTIERRAALLDAARRGGDDSQPGGLGVIDV